MNKDTYKRTFLALHPSDATMERILNMGHKKRRMLPMGLVVAIVALLIAACGMLTANAASGGEVVKNIQKSTTKVMSGIRVFLGDREVTSECESTADGTYIYTWEDEETNSSGEVEWRESAEASGLDIQFDVDTE